MSLTRVPDFRNTERHQEALDRLMEIVVSGEGCPMPTEACGCSGDDCVISILLETGRRESEQSCHSHTEDPCCHMCTYHSKRRGEKQ